jgi:WD40 repeat protein
VRVWDAASGATVIAQAGHAPLAAVAWCPAGTFIAAGGSAGVFILELVL